MGLKCNQMYPYKSKAEGALRKTRTERVYEDGVERKCGHKLRNADRHQKLKKVRTRLSPRDSGRGVVC